ncbi:MAG: endo alpha-1,4 polygalactosaminidase [Myxococcales bacterium]|nr:endo alpha-1,4 polygalactosaminidase [Myxococcales bacterium]
MNNSIRVVAFFVLGACAADESGSSGITDPGGKADAPDGEGGPMFTLPPVNAGVDYQLGGAYTPAAGVRIVSRDRTAPAAPGLYNICYVNGFQIQPGEETFWETQHPTLILRDASGDPVIDADWNEMLIDVSTAAKRSEVASIVADWIEGCAVSGYDAIEIDNLDSFSRSGTRLTEANNVAAMRLFAAAAHAHGLAAAQKNSAELVGRKTEMGTDFVVAEECNHYGECGDYMATYGNHVIAIEYLRADFQRGCSAFPGLSIVLRDRDVRPRGASGYVFDGC